MRKYFAIALLFAGISSRVMAETTPGAATPAAPSASGLSQSGGGGGGPNPGGIAPSGSADNFLFTGSALYSLPIQVPPGVGGMQPELSLQYNSSAGNGWVGVGWDLSLGVIQRSTKSGPPNYDASDIFVVTMKGQSIELVKLPDNTYRGKIEGAFQKFTQSNGAWIVYDKSGTRYFFGQTAATRLDHPTAGTFLWALDKVVDRNGNAMGISYVKDQNQIYLQSILYSTGNVSGVEVARRTNFGLENRPDLQTSYRPGFKQVTAKRLSNTTSYVLIDGQWKQAKAYTLAYHASVPNRVRSELASVTVSASDGIQTIAMPPVSFQYAGSTTNWVNQGENSLWQFPERMIVTKDYDGQATFSVRENGNRFGDVNGDGRPDLIHCIKWDDGGLENRTYLNTQHGWEPTGTWISPVWFTYVLSNEAGTDDNGVRVVDLNGDGKVDILQSLAKTTHTFPTADVFYQHVWINNGSGWTEQTSQWKFPLLNGTSLYFTIASPFGIPSVDTGLQLSDLNGDGRPDLIQSIKKSNGTSVRQHVWLNNGSGWTAADNWVLPDVLFIQDPNLNSSVRPNGAQLLDLNGDGLADFVQRYFINNNGTEVNKVYLNKGPGWEDVTSTWQLPDWIGVSDNMSYRDNGVEFADINGDGLVDWLQSIQMACTGCPDRTGVFLNTGNGWRNETANWSIPDYFTRMYHAQNYMKAYSNGYFFVDVNADGQADLLRARFHWNSGVDLKYVGLSRAFPEVMSQITSPIGGKTKFTYDFSARQIGSDNKIPFSAPIIKQLDQEDGIGASVTTRYNYDQGFFDPTEREYLGFGKVDTIDTANNYTRTYFHQNKDVGGSVVAANVFKGRAYLTERHDSAGDILASQETRWQYTTPYPGVYFPRPEFTKSTIYEGVQSPLSTQVNYSYDDISLGGAGVGNVTQADYLGDITLSGDERTEKTEYASNSVSYLMSFPSRTQVLGPSNNILSDTKIYYDGSLTPGVVTAGNPTQIDRLVDLGTSKWISAKSQYNSLGQVTSVTDAKNQTSLTTYNQFGFPITVTNAKGFQLKSTFDALTGNVLADIDINNSTTTYTYDLLGRKTKTMGPLSSMTFPTVEYDYHDELLGLPGQQYVETRMRESFGTANVYINKSYFDGLGRSYRNDEEDVGGNWRTAETQFDSRGFAVKSSVPRRLNPPTAPQWVETAYDSFGRVTQVKQPDQSVTVTSYYGRSIDVSDANGNKQSSTSDAWGRTITRNEPSIGVQTQYGYDAAGNLSQVTDSKGKQTTFTYDLLGRKLSMVDPNAGAWSYIYDDVGNLMSQIDPRGVKLTFQYDSLNRLCRKVLAADPIPATGQVVGSTITTYTYDEVSRPFYKGKLTTVTDASGTTRFYHDALGRTVQEQKQISGTYYDVFTTYDAMSRPVQIVYPSSDVVKLVYNDGGQLSAVTNGAGTVTYASYPSYNGLGQKLMVNKGDGAFRNTYTYDPLRSLLSNLKTEVLIGGVTTQTLQNLSYTFDPVGNITAIADGVNPTRSQTFSYDALYRLKNASGVYGYQAFDYDNLGNFNTKNNLSYTYNLSTHPYAVSSVMPSQQPARDSSTVMAWNLDPTEPIYSLKGSVQKAGGVFQSSVAVVLSGPVDLLVWSSTKAVDLGTFEIKGIAGGSSANYDLFVASAGMTSSPLSSVFNPVNQSAINLDFTLSSTTPVNLGTVRIPRTTFVSGSPQGVHSTGTYVGGIIGSSGYGGTESTMTANWSNISGYNALGDAADLQTQATVQFLSPPTPTCNGSLGPTFVTGRYQQALSFNGASDIFAMPETSGIAVGNFTTMIWVKLTANPSGYATLLSKSSATALGKITNGYRVLLNSSRKVIFESGTGSGSKSVTSNGALTLNKWAFVTTVYDGSKLKIYIDGALDKETTATSAPVTNTIPIVIGASMDCYRRICAGTLFKGILDEPRLHSRAWSAVEINRAYQDFLATASYQYDDAGNMVSKTSGDQQWTYRYDAEGRLNLIKLNGVAIDTILYDGDGGRVTKTTSAGTTRYIGKLFEVRPADTAAGLPASNVAHVFGGGELICDITKPTSGGTGSTWYYHADHLGSVSVITDSTGTKVQEYAYDPFGSVVIKSGASPLHHTYTGQEDDPESGLMFYNARYYDTALGRFISPDSIVPSIVDPQSFNRYSYTRNNPVNLIDPTGHSFSLKNAYYIFLLPYAPTLAYNGMNGNINNSQDFQHYAYQAAAYNAAIGGIGLVISALTPGAIVNEFLKEAFVGTWEVKASVSYEGQEVASVGSEGWAVLGWSSAGLGAGGGAYEVNYHLQQTGSGMDSGKNNNVYAEPGAGDYQSDRPVYAVQSGYVFRSGWQYESDHNGGLGWRVSVMTSANGSYDQYGHMDPATTVDVGSSVRKGQYIGSYANPTNGRSNAPHVHYERRNSSGVTVNPGNISPLRGGRVTTSFGVTDGMHPGVHGGIDWAY